MRGTLLLVKNGKIVPVRAVYRSRRKVSQRQAEQYIRRHPAHFRGWNRRTAIAVASQIVGALRDHAQKG